jgi:AcrR family transcriptional regulator
LLATGNSVNNGGVIKTTNTSRRQEGDKAREIVDAGRRVIFREGIWNTTTRKIAEEAGITLAAIHYYFANKDELLVAVYEQMLAAIRASAVEDFAQPGTLVERIEGLIDVSWKYSKKNMEGQLMQSELALYALRNGLPSLAARQSQEYLDIYVRVLRSASDVAKREKLDIAGLARFIMAGTDGILAQHLAEPDEGRSERACAQLARVALSFPLTSGPKPITPLTLFK